MQKISSSSKISQNNTSQEWHFIILQPNALRITLSKQHAANLYLSPKHYSRRENWEFSVVDLAVEF